MYQLIFGDENNSSAPQPTKTNQSEQPLTVSELTDKIKSAIKKNLPATVLVAGEISNLTFASSGHVYFTLKDEQSQISCALWRSNAVKVKFELTDGLAVVVQGYVDVYPPRGQYQLYAERISPFGLGELELAFRQLKEKLQKEGLFDPAHKKPIPAFPLTIAVVTSPTGAAVRDILRTLELRWPVGKVLLYGVQVQGTEAAPQIAAALNDLNKNAEQLKIDVIILARGGGSLEDLWAFNEEIVARAIYDSALPIITGVGHEVDITIADFVADHRAATPTAAAQAAAPVLAEILAGIEGQYQRLRNVTRQKMTIEKGRLKNLADRGMFKHPLIILGPFAQRFDETVQRLNTALKKIATQSRNRTHNAELKLGKISPNVLLARANNTIVKLLQQLGYTLSTFLATQKGSFEQKVTLLKIFTANVVKTKSTTVTHLDARLSALDYRQVLNRGFAIVRREKDSKIVTSVDMIVANEMMQTELLDGKITSEVKAKSDKN